METLAHVTLDDLSLGYPRRGASARYRALDGITLSVAAGEILAVIGGTGSGKSTLARFLSGSVTGSARPRLLGGAARVLGGDPRRDRGAQHRSLMRRLGYLPQDVRGVLNPRLTVHENLLDALGDPGSDDEGSSLRAAAALDSCALSLGLLTRFPHELSTGQRQRAALALIIASEPELFIADEPTAGIDILTRDVVAQALIRGRERGASSIIITHDRYLVEDVADRVLILDEGHVIGLDTVANLDSGDARRYLLSLRGGGESPESERKLLTTESHC